MFISIIYVIPSIPSNNIKKFTFYSFALLITLQLIYSSLIIKDIIKLQEIKEVPYVSKNQVLGIKMTMAIIKQESGGNCNAKGLSGEKGCAQWLSSTWKNYTKKYFATTTMPLTKENEIKVLTAHNVELLNEGYPLRLLPVAHNAGSPKAHCGRGTNRWGVKYDCPAYVQSVLALVK